MGPVRGPIVPAAGLFDLGVGEASVRPDAAAGRAACAAPSAQPLPAGSVGAGAGATVGKLWGLEHAMKGGIGGASVKVGGITVAAVVAVNALGDENTQKHRGGNYHEKGQEKYVHGCGDALLSAAPRQDNSVSRIHHRGKNRREHHRDEEVSHHHDERDGDHSHQNGEKCTVI